MRKPLQAFNAENLATYLLLLQPHEDLRSRIKECRNDFSDKYDLPIISFPPTISLVRFSQSEDSETEIIKSLEKFSFAFAPFIVELLDYGCYPMHSIYINVKSKNPVIELVKSIRSHSQGLLQPDKEHKPFFNLEPVIMIAEKLKPWQFEKGWQEISHSNFKGSFLARELILLKKGEGAYRFKELRKFEFRNAVSEIVQPRLF